MDVQLNLNLISGGSILPNRMVKLSTAADFTGLAAGANEAAIGVSAGSTRDPVTDASAPNEANSGDPISLQPGFVWEVELGGTVARGDNLIASTAGVAITAVLTGTTVQNILGKALQSGASGDLIQMFYQPLAIRPALT